MLDCADKLLGKRIKNKSNILKTSIKSVFDIQKLKKRVMLRLMEDIDEPNLVSIGSMSDCLEMISRHGMYKGSTKEATVDL